MKIGICTLIIGEEYKRITNQTFLNKKEYVNKYGYSLIDCNESLDINRTPHWSKMLLLLKHLSDYDYLVWMDADLYIMNDDIKLEDYIRDKMKDKDLMVATDYSMSNTGVFFVKNSAWSKDFLKAWYDHVDFPVIGNYEQDSFQDLQAKNFMDMNTHVIEMKPEDANSYYWYYKKGHFIFHFAGARGWQIESMVNQFCPMRMESDTDETYNYRMKKLEEMNINK